MSFPADFLVVVFPSVERFLRSDRQFLPSNQTIRVLTLRGWVLRISHAALIHDLVEAPTVSEVRTDG